MKLSRGLLLFLLCALFWGAGWAQSDPYFVVNGQSCEEGYCAINVVSYGVGRPLQIRMAGSYPGGALDLFLSFNGKKKSLQGVSLEYHGYSVSLGAERLQLNASQAAQLFGSGLPLRLHLGELNASASGVISVHARRVGSIDDLARLDITLEGLRVPGEELPWYPNRLTHNLQPTIVVPIYPNPVRQGPIFLDLQAFPSAATGTVSVMDLLGSRLYRAAVTGGSVHQFPSEKFPKGFYFVRIEMNGASVYTARLVIEK